MSQLVTIQIPQDWIEGIPEEDLTLKEIFRMGIHEYKVKRAIQLYKEGVGSLGYIAEKIGVLKHDLIREFRLRHIEPEFSESTLKEELGQ
jgi:predicted HTH domain antitoxin